ncbi:MAG: hypothetical protein GY882_01890 [Actinomycetia bacterium]|nr:hypothetical protein [Actinomycetes bacterium]
MSRHPELARLIADYEAILARHNAGTLTQDAALAALAAMWVSDGVGYEWSIDPQSGRYIRRVPGADAEFADEHQFAPTTIPVQQPADVLAPPTPAPHQVPAPAPQYVEELSGVPAPSFMERIQPMMRNPRAKWLVVAVAVLFLLVGAKACGGSAPADEDGGIPVVTTTTAPTGFKASSTTLPTITVPEAAPEVPTPDQVGDVNSRFTSGDRGLFIETVAAEISADVIALEAAAYAGFVEHGITVDFGIADIDPATGNIVSFATLADAQSGVVLRNSVLAWVLVEGNWKLAALPGWSVAS